MLIILRNVYQALPQNGKLLLLETVVPESVNEDIGTSLDFNLLTMVGGKERTKMEFDALLTKSGFEITYISTYSGIISLIISEKRN